MTADDNGIVILGGKGMLGTDLVKTCLRQNLNVDVLDQPEFDITNPKQLEAAIKGKSIIVNCAAYTNVDGAESQADLAYCVNATAPGMLGEMVKKNGAWLLHISTDFVFDGALNRPYDETDTPNPINEYGRSKLAGEKFVAESGCQYCIIRIEWTYGSAGNNFVAKLIQRANTGQSLKVVDDQVGSPTATTEAAQMICKLMNKKPQGLYHFASAGYVSRYDMAKFVFEKLKMETIISPCKSSDFKTPAIRPLNSRFDCSKIQALLDEPIKTWQETLEVFLKNRNLDLGAKNLNLKV
jgi:dTDP-4-dehydrorhamnose reductase